MKKEFYSKLIEISKNLNINPKDVLLVLFIESGLKSSAINPDGGAVGLNQFYGSTFDSYVGSHGVTRGEYKDYSPEDQLPFIESFFRDMIGNRKNLTAAQLYLANFVPASLNFQGVKDKDRNAIIAEENSNKKYPSGLRFDNVYSQNKSLDFNHDGKITYGDIEDLCNAKSQNSLFQKHLSNLELVSQGKEIEEIQDSKGQDGSAKEDGSTTSKKPIVKFIEKMIDAMQDAIGQLT